MDRLKSAVVYPSEGRTCLEFVIGSPPGQALTIMCILTRMSRMYIMRFSFVGLPGKKRGASSGRCGAPASCGPGTQRSRKSPCLRRGGSSQRIYRAKPSPISCLDLSSQAVDRTGLDRARGTNDCGALWVCLKRTSLPVRFGSYDPLTKTNFLNRTIQIELTVGRLRRCRPSTTASERIRFVAERREWVDSGYYRPNGGTGW